MEQGGLPKGDALATARIAGIMAAKRTPDLVPLCHPISISGVTVDLAVGDAEVRISATVRTTDRTGVEMEALTAVAVAGLTLHDMIKAVDPAAVLDAVRVERKDGGKTGTWTRPETKASEHRRRAGAEEWSEPGVDPMAPETRRVSIAGAPAPRAERAGSRPEGSSAGVDPSAPESGVTHEFRTGESRLACGAADRGGDHRLHPGGQRGVPGPDRAS